MAASVELWLQSGHDGEPGVEAIACELLGFGTWAETRDELEAKLESKLGEYLAWRERAGLPASGVSAHARMVSHERTHAKILARIRARSPERRLGRA